MKKFKRLAYIFLIAIIVILSFALYTNASKDSDETQKEKTYTEIKYLESKIMNLLNSMNNIETRNYNVSVSEIMEQSNNNSNTGTSTSSGSNSSSEKTSGENSFGMSGESSNNQNSSNNNQNIQSEDKFELKQQGILTTSENINWNNIKNEVETLYDSLPTITLDLYQLNINKEDILNFNKEFDNLTVIIKNEKKEETLAQLSKLYEYIPKFIQNATDNEVDKILAESKSNIFKAYANLDSENWNIISNDLNNATNIFSKLLTDINIDENKQYYISKAYVMINELQNAVNVKDKSIFLIKYKNLMEEFNNI